MTRIVALEDVSYPPRDMEMALSLIPELGLSVRAEYIARGLFETRLAMGHSLLESWAIVLECALQGSRARR
jgi:hypothetical protein